MRTSAYLPLLFLFSLPIYAFIPVLAWANTQGKRILFPVRADWLLTKKKHKIFKSHASFLMLETSALDFLKRRPDAGISLKEQILGKPSVLNFH
jgi:hypothetical protein